VGFGPRPSVAAARPGARRCHPSAVAPPRLDDRTALIERLVLLFGLLQPVERRRRKRLRPEGRDEVATLLGGAGDVARCCRNPPGDRLHSLEVLLTERRVCGPVLNRQLASSPVHLDSDARQQRPATNHLAGRHRRLGLPAQLVQFRNRRLRSLEFLAKHSQVLGRVRVRVDRRAPVRNDVVLGQRVENLLQVVVGRRNLFLPGRCRVILLGHRLEDAAAGQRTHAGGHQRPPVRSSVHCSTLGPLSA